MKVITFHFRHRPSESATPPKRDGPIVSLGQGAFCAAIGLVIGILLGDFVLNRPAERTLIGRAVPEFTLPPVKGNSLGLSSGDLRGSVSLVNVFASWCAACRSEHPLIMRIAARGFVPVYGLNYRDRPGDAVHWLKTLGDPYTRIGSDLTGHVAATFDVREPPETILIDQLGRVVYRHRGPLKREDFRDAILPLLRSLLEVEEGDY